MFERAIADMRAKESMTSGPVPFRSYSSGTSNQNAIPAPWIAKDSLESLAPELKNARTMVFRLGSPSGEKHTHFALARCVKDWGDYFLLDEILCGATRPQFFLPAVAADALVSFPSR